MKRLHILSLFMVLIIVLSGCNKDQIGDQKNQENNIREIGDRVSSQTVADDTMAGVRENVAYRLFAKTMHILSELEIDLSVSIPEKTTLPDVKEKLSEDKVSGEAYYVSKPDAGNTENVVIIS